MEVPRTLQGQQLLVHRTDAAGVLQDLCKEAVVLVLVERLGVTRRQADRDRHVVRRHGRGHHKLGALSCRKGQRHHRVHRRDALPRLALVDDRGAELPRPIKRQARHIDPLPALHRFEEHLAGPVDANLRDPGIAQELGDPQDVVLVLQKLRRNVCNGFTVGALRHVQATIPLSASRWRSPRRAKRRC